MRLTQVCSKALSALSSQASRISAAVCFTSIYKERGSERCGGTEPPSPEAMSPDSNLTALEKLLEPIARIGGYLIDIKAEVQMWTVSSTAVSDLTNHLP